MNPIFWTFERCTKQKNNCLLSRMINYNSYQTSSIHIIWCFEPLAIPLHSNKQRKQMMNVWPIFYEVNHACTCHNQDFHP